MTAVFAGDESVSEGCLLTDIEGRITSVSPDALALFDRSAGEMVGRFIADFVPREQLSRLGDAYRALIETGHSVRCTLALPGRGEAAPEIQARLFVVQDAGGRPRAISLTLTPPPQLQPEGAGDSAVEPAWSPPPSNSELESDPPPLPGSAGDGAEALVQALMETRALGLSVTAPDGTLLRLNALAAEIMGIDTGIGTSIGSDEWTVAGADGTPLDPSQYPAAIALREGRAVTGQEIRVQRPDGEWRWLSVSSAPVDHPDYGVIIAYTDVTESKESEARLKATFESISDLVFSLDRQGRYGVLEGGAGSAFLDGRSASEFSGTLRSEGTGDDPVHRDALDRAFAGEHVVYEWRFDRLDPPRWVQTSLSPMNDASGEINHVVGVTRDVTDRVSLEEARLEMQRRSVEAQKAESLAVLAGGVAHDFNNLLSGVLLNAELARRDVGPTDLSRELLDDIVAAAERATELSRQMLAYSGRGAIHRSRVQPNEIARALRSALGPTLAPGQTLDLDLADRLPEVEGDQSQIWQALYNVTSNALEAGGDHGRVTLTTALVDFDPSTSPLAGATDHLAAGRFVDIAVADDGPGIDPEMRDRVFEPFFNGGFRGRGLGLSAAQGAMLAHGGAILHEPGPAGGTRFHLLLPLTEVAAPAAVRDGDAPDPASERRRTILFADDEHIVRRAGARLLQALDFDVIEAEDGERALDLWEEHREAIDLVILDVTMPRLGGRETLARLRERAPGLRILLTSGYDAADVLGTPGPTPDGFIEKPFRLDHVRAQVEAVMA